MIRLGTFLMCLSFTLFRDKHHSKITNCFKHLFGLLLSLMFVVTCLTGHGLRAVHLRGIQRHRGVELEWDVDRQRYSHQTDPDSVSLFRVTVCHCHTRPP